MGEATRTIPRCGSCGAEVKQEEWRAVASFEGRYEVSDWGRVRNSLTGHMVAVTTKPSGYKRVRLSDGSTPKNFYVHRLVLFAFVGPCPEGMEACHYDGDPSNNRVNNLRWDTHVSNAADKKRHGTDRNVGKTHCLRGHLLSEPNLRAAHLKRGQRSCLACASARTTVSRTGGDINELADRHYQRITGSSPLHWMNSGG